MSYTKKGLPWIQGAKDVSDCTTAREVMAKSGLNFFVKKCELVARMPFSLQRNYDKLEDDEFSYEGNIYKDCPNAFATYRTDTNTPLGVVKSRYEVVQNTDAFNFFDNAIGKDKAIFQTAGSFGNGHRIFVSVKLPNTVELVNKDVIDSYLIFTNTHDGSSGITILFSPIRVVCENTLNAAIKHAQSFITFRHTQSVHNRIDEAQELLGISAKMSENSALLYNNLISKEINDLEAVNVIAKTFLTDAEINKVNEYNSHAGFNAIANRNALALEATGISSKKANIIHNAAMYYFTGIGQKEIVGTNWGVYNAITGYFSNVANLEGNKRMDSLLYGNGSNISSKALNMLVA